MPPRTGDHTTHLSHWPILGLATISVALVLGWSARVRCVVPPCPSRVLLDLPCPACGTTRVLTALGQGRVLDALALAPLPTLAAIGLVGLGALAAARLALGRAPLPQALVALGERRGFRAAIGVGALGLWAITLWTGSSR